MFDIKARIEQNLKDFDNLREDLKDGKIEDFFFIVRFKDDDRPCQFFFEMDNADSIQWVGIFEYLKNLILFPSQDQP